jgi:ADP-L-glycero-D-manno-heptose 6-epimerase
MLILTGAAGFIGSALAADLLAHGQEDLVLVDDFSREEKRANYKGKAVKALVERSDFFAWVKGKEAEIAAIIHLGARTDTAEQDTALFDRLNLHYSQQMWALCVRYGLPLIYASSAATYGGGEHGFEDSHGGVRKLRPLNPYGWSKQQFDLWALEQQAAPPFWAGLKFFNVYGPNEYHKGRMASVIFHAFRQIQATGKLRLFRSHRPDYAHGEQRRDFVYVKDLTAVVRFLLQGKAPSGLYNLGTGQARSFNDLGRAVFASLGQEPVIEYVGTPADIRAAYQYFTEANMTKLRAAGYLPDFTSLEEGVSDYVQGFLRLNKYY